MVHIGKQDPIPNGVTPAPQKDVSPVTQFFRKATAFFQNPVQSQWIQGAVRPFKELNAEKSNPLEKIGTTTGKIFDTLTGAVVRQKKYSEELQGLKRPGSPLSALTDDDIQQIAQQLVKNERVQFKDLLVLKTPKGLRVLSKDSLKESLRAMKEGNIPTEHLDDLVTGVFEHCAFGKKLYFHDDQAHPVRQTKHKKDEPAHFARLTWEGDYGSLQPIIIKKYTQENPAPQGASKTVKHSVLIRNAASEQCARIKVTKNINLEASIGRALKKAADKEHPGRGKLYFAALESAPVILRKGISSKKAGYLYTQKYENDLNTYFEKSASNLTDTDKLILIYHLMQGLKVMHDAGWIHRDIKPPNIFMGNDKLPRWADFGLSVKQGQIEEQNGTDVFLPESYKRAKENELGHYHQPALDLYALALTLDYLYFRPDVEIQRKKIISYKAWSFQNNKTQILGALQQQVMSKMIRIAGFGKNQKLEMIPGAKVDDALAAFEAAFPHIKGEWEKRIADLEKSSQAHV